MRQSADVFFFRPLSLSLSLPSHSSFLCLSISTQQKMRAPRKQTIIKQIYGKYAFTQQPGEKPHKFFSVLRFEINNILKDVAH